MFFVQEDATTKRSDRLLRMKLGSAPVQLVHEPVGQFDLQVAATRDKKYIAPISAPPIPAKCGGCQPTGRRARSSPGIKNRGY